MQKIISITQARAQLPSLIKQINLKDIYISVKSKVKAVLIDATEYERLKETIEVLSDQKLMRNLEKSIKEFKKGELTDWEDLKKKLTLD
ncbi:MAG: type II toxin-antitoxin system Phd/YefM family antitoxin [Candidatus Woesebacteria bacterium]